jgi:small conductance mechanosensitive channel
MDAVKDVPGLLQDEEITMHYREFGDSSINFVIRLWLNNPEQATYWTASNQAIIRIKKAYDKNDIMIPFPIRTLDFGIKGGQQLSEMKINIPSTS